MKELNKLPNGVYRIGPPGTTITTISADEEKMALAEMEDLYPDLTWYVDIFGVMKPGKYSCDQLNKDSQEMTKATALSREADPHGKDPSEPGAKCDAGKIRVALMEEGFPRALMAVAEVTTFGAKKYTDHGWLAVPDAFKRYSDAAGRHRLKRLAGEERDADSGLLHLQHEAWGLLAMLELRLQGMEEIQ